MNWKKFIQQEFSTYEHWFETSRIGRKNEIASIFSFGSMTPSGKLCLRKAHIWTILLLNWASLVKYWQY